MSIFRNLKKLSHKKNQYFTMFQKLKKVSPDFYDILNNKFYPNGLLKENIFKGFSVILSSILRLNSDIKILFFVTI